MTHLTQAHVGHGVERHGRMNDDRDTARGRMLPQIVEENKTIPRYKKIGSSAESVGALWSILGAQPQSPGFSRHGSGVRWTLHDGQGSVR